jgi:hypothetical protein
MARVADAWHRLIEWLFVPLDPLGEDFALAVVSILTGVMLLVLVRFTTPQERVAKARNRMMSAVYETRLFLNNPRRLVVAQGRLLGWGALYVGTLLPALLVMALPLALVYLHLDARVGQAPLPLHTPVVLRLDLKSDAPAVDAEVPPGVLLTAPAVRLEDPDQVYFRLEITSLGVYEVVLRSGSYRVKKRLVASGTEPVSSERATGVEQLWVHGLEPALPPEAPFTRLTVFHEPRRERWLGLPWWAVWMLGATLSALVLKRPLGVEL